MALPTLAELLTIPTQDQILDQEVLPAAAGRGAKVTSWPANGVYRGWAYATAKLRLEARKAIAAFCAGGFGDYAFGFVAPPFGIDITSWAPDLARNGFGVEQIKATHTKRTLRLTNAVAAAYGPVPAGRIVVQFPSGNRYVNDAEVTIGASTTTDAVFRSEFTNDAAAGRSYGTDAPATSPIVLVTNGYPGVTVTNPRGDYTAVAQLGSGLGTLTLSGSPTGEHTVSVRIKTSGQSGAATWETSADGAAWVDRSNAASITNLGGYGIDIALTNGASAPSFIGETVYSFSTPGTDITQVGRDIETPRELGTRCRAIFPLLAFALDSAGNWIWQSPTISGYEALARSASTQVKVCFVITDPAVNNKVRIYVAGQGALVPTSVITTLQAFFASRTMITDRPVIAAPALRTITLGGATITWRQGQLTTGLAALTSSLARYLGGVDPVAPLSVNGTIDRAYLVGLIRNAPGAVSTDADTTLTINGAAANLVLPVTGGAYEMAKWEQTATTAFTSLTV